MDSNERRILREAIGHIADDAPSPPDFDDLKVPRVAESSPRRWQPSPLVAATMGFAAAVVLAGGSLLVIRAVLSNGDGPTDEPPASVIDATTPTTSSTSTTLEPAPPTTGPIATPTPLEAPPLPVNASFEPPQSQWLAADVLLATTVSIIAEDSDALSTALTKASLWEGVQPDSDGMHLSLDRCTVVAPTEWVIEGAVELPTGVTSANALITTSVIWGDVGEGWLYEVRFGRSGTFALSHSTAESLRGWVAADPAGVRPPSVYRSMDGNQCQLGIIWSDIPVAEAAFHPQEAEWASEPVEWPAPAGTIQGLGSGVVMADPDDPKTTWAYLAWLDVALPVDLLAVPDPDSGMSVRLIRTESDPDERCQVVILELDDEVGEIWHGRGCSGPPFVAPTSAMPIEQGSPFYFSVEGGEPVYSSAFASIGDMTLVIETDSDDPDAIRSIARALRLYHNVVGGYPACSATGLDATVTNQDGLTGAVDATRRTIFELASSCDIDGLAQLGLEGSQEFWYRIGWTGDASGFWREAEQEGDHPMQLLVGLLNLPYEELEDSEGAVFYEWPNGRQWLNLSQEDKEAIRSVVGETIYEQTEQLGEYLGPRLVIAASGEWVSFVLGGD